MEISKKIIPGLVAIFILIMIRIFTNTVNELFDWIIDVAIAYSISLFLYEEIIEAIEQRNLDIIDIVSISIGVVAFVTYIVVFSLTILDAIVNVLEAIFVITLFETVWHILKKKIEMLG